MKEFRVFSFIATLSTLLLVSVNGQINSPCTATTISSYTPCINYITGSSSNGTSPTAACCNTLKTLMSTNIACTCLVLTANVPLLPINRTLALYLPRACHMDDLPLQCKASGAPLPAPGKTAEKYMNPIQLLNTAKSRMKELQDSNSTLENGRYSEEVARLGPVLFGPAPRPTASAPLSPRASKAHALAPAPASETTQPVAPASPTLRAKAPAPTVQVEAPASPTVQVETPASPTMQVEAPKTTAGIRPVLSPSASVPSCVCPTSSLLLLLAITVFKSY